MNKEEEENEKSIYNYNMIFNRINNYEEDIKFNTDLISDIDLQNFDPERYEYYTNLLYIYNKDPKTLYDLLNKYYNIKSMHEKEKGIIKYIYDYARKLKEHEKDDEDGEGGKDKGATGGGGRTRRRRKRRNRQSGGVNRVNTWQNKFINVLKGKMPDKKVIKVEPSKEKDAEENADTEEDYYVELKDDKVEKLSKKIDKLEEEIKRIQGKTNPSLGSTMYADLKGRIYSLFNRGKKINNDNAVKTLSELETLIQGFETLKKELEVSKTSNIAEDANKKKQINDIEENIRALLKEQGKIRALLKEQGKINSEEEREEEGEEEGEGDAQQLFIQNKPPDQLSNSLGAITDIANAVLTTSLSGLSSTPDASTPVRGRSSDTPVIANSITDLTTLGKSLGAGAAISGGAGNSDEQLKMRYLDNNKYKEINTWKKIKELKKEHNSQPESIDENNKIARLSQDIDAYNSSEKNKKDEDYIIQQLNNFENDPKNPLDELAITFDDRLVFIIATFFIRYITIIIVQWCIDINIIKTFYEGFIYYAIIYIIIFWFIVLFINIDNSYDVKYMNFNGIINSIRTLFYYFYMGTNGISRLLVHTSLIIILIIIPIILNIKRKADYVDDEQTETEKILNNDERKQLSKSLSLFTMFIWLFTSIIATKF